MSFKCLWKSLPLVPYLLFFYTETLAQLRHSAELNIELNRSSLMGNEVGTNSPAKAEENIPLSSILFPRFQAQEKIPTS